MRSWSISEARARISEVVDAVLADGPQRIERRDSAPVVVVSEEIWQKLAAEYPSFADLVLDAPIEDADLPGRAPARVFDTQDRG
ncbi:MAG: type II toxin-antitoxin system Phd/YefM family antitoxin [Rhizobiaceae bacterium]|jgi:prevent-host-death family protein